MKFINDNFYGKWPAYGCMEIYIAI